ncbi:LysM peptidoglycan-binding domain-containing protein [Facklamia sp. DSM 111018]|uniref:LysM peptidoglycan-binding domain-containing protein n=1 Tax=Facklamia lactis TaxID=2749967 RepID=A0ABS0LN56_9LACT|nr:LysM domain-containing protein [Facklamia lactis]MBG9979841.1 LysM peptidoglycan-binding domain-containing protein [Facklamia lactis]MBG9985479.1 LysM peptidoglycan-binding domain-containing protein [Facklamia lactis]
MANDNEKIRPKTHHESPNGEDLKSKKFSAPWNKKFGEDENFKNRQYSRSSRNQPAKEATTLSQVLLFVLIVALLAPFILYAVVDSQRDKQIVEDRTAEQVRMSKQAQENTEDESKEKEKSSESATEEESKDESDSVSTRKIESEESEDTTDQRETTTAQEPTPTPEPEPEPTPTPEPETEPSSTYHTVGGSESWWSISQAYGVDVYELAAANGASIDTPIHPGTQIIIP